MIKPDTAIIKTIASMSRSHPKFLVWLTAWEKHEKDTLPVVLNNTAVAQGRCQVLAELVELVTKSPDLA